jgi:Cu(I)/Ag(I) efflux system membrane protein CusA/SilA
MPTTMPHSGVDYNRKVMGQIDMLVTSIPEVELTVGKMGRVESALDPAPVSMFENVINYKPEYILDEKGHRQKFRTDRDGNFILVSGDTLFDRELVLRHITAADLVPDEDGRYFRNWRDEINSPDDIWDEIVRVTKIPGLTSAPKLQPIETRLVMLQTGMRAPMGIKVYGPDLPTIEKFGIELENILKEVPSVKSEAVFADRIVGKPYIHLNINREEIARYGLNVEDVQRTIETAIGGMKISSTVEGRERFPIRVRYPRELRDDPSSLGKILMPTPTGAQIPLSQVLDIEYVRGPQAIKSEETFLVGYVLFDKRDGYSEVTVVNDAQKTIRDRIDDGSLQVPAGVSYKFSGSYENQVRAEKRLSLIVPLVLIIVFLILYFQFKSVSTSLMVFSGITIAFGGGFIMLWLYGQGWFGNFEVFGTNIRELFQMQTINLSVAVWVGFIALFGIATDDGVLIATYLDQSFRKNKPKTRSEVREATIEAGLRRVRPALMTVSTTMVALLPVLTSTGRGADIMIPMAIPAFGGMAFAIVTIFVVPVLYSFREERKLKNRQA